MHPIHILLVEDSEGDILLITEAIASSNSKHKVDVVRNGYEATLFLNKTEPYKDKKTPELILLDINMPIMNGLEFLDFVKSEDRFKHLPVVMLTTSSAKSDILKSYQKYSNSYIVKPDKDYDQLVGEIERYWTTVAVLPKGK